MTTIIFLMLLFINQQNGEPNNEFANEHLLNDSTNYVDISELGIRVIYPKCIQPKRTRFFQNNGVLSLSIGSYAKGSYWNEINMGIEIATQNSIRRRSDFYQERMAKGGMNDGLEPQTEREFGDRRKMFIDNDHHKYYDDYCWVGNRKYGIRLWSAENYGNATDCCTYMDSLQITISLTSHADSLGMKVNEMMKNIFGEESEIRRVRDIGHKLLLEALYQKYFLKILNRVQFLKL